VKIGAVSVPRVLRFTFHALLSPILFDFRRQIDCQRIDAQDFQLYTAVGALGNLTDHDVSAEENLAGAFGTRCSCHF